MSNASQEGLLADEIERAKLYRQAREQFGTAEQVRRHVVFYARAARKLPEALFRVFDPDEFEQENIAMRICSNVREGSHVEVALYCKQGQSLVFRFYPDLNHVVPDTRYDPIQ